MILPSLDRVRALPRLAEITRTFLRFGLHDLVHSVGLHRVLDRTSEWLGWKADTAVSARPLPERLRLALEALGPTFVKLGQVLASRVDLLPPDWIAELERLHSGVPPVPFAELEVQLVHDLGKPIAEAFATFERTPAAAASIAQIHRASLPDGTAVAVKIRRPGIEPLIDADLTLLEVIATWWEEEEPAARRFQPAELVRQLKKSIGRELDFAAEARGQERFADNFRERPEIVIPKVYNALTRRSLLVMDWVEGIPATDLAAVDRAGFDRARLAARGADAVLQMVLVDGLFHADPHPGNVFYLPGERLALIDFGMVGWLSEKRRDELADLLAALAGRDALAMRDVLLGWADGRRVDGERFAEDLSRLIHLYDHATLDAIRMDTLLAEIAGIMREHHLLLPADLALLFKALISLEGLGQKLDPGFRLIEHVTPHIRRLLQARWEPRAVGTRAYRQLRDLSGALGELPGLARKLAHQVSEDGVAFNIEVRQMDRLTRHIEKSVNRVTIGMVTAALIVGSSILLTVTGGPEVMGVSVFGVAGILVALINSLWLIVSIYTASRKAPE